MSTRTSLTTQEPAAVVAVVVALVAALLTLLAAFGLELTDDQRTAIIGFVTVAAPLVVGFIVRRSVTPSANVVVQLDKAGEVIAGDASPVPSGLILEPGATIEDVTP